MLIGEAVSLQKKSVLVPDSEAGWKGLVTGFDEEDKSLEVLFENGQTWWVYESEVKEDDFPLQPFQQVLYRNSDSEPWTCGFYSHKEDGVHVLAGGNYARMVLPFTADLVGKV